MKSLLPLLCLLSMTFAEPPVRDGYPASRSQEYTFGATRNAISTEHSPPSSRSSSPSTKYGLPNTRSSSPSTEYGLPNARSSSLSTEYGLPNTRSSFSTEYSLPNSRSSSLSTEYGLPNARLLTSGTGTENSLSNARSANRRQKYAPPAAIVSFSQTYSSPKNQGLSKSISQEYGAPKNTPSQNNVGPYTRSGISLEYGVPSSRSGISDEYGTLDTRSGPSEEYGVPNTRSGISQEYEKSQSRSGPSKQYAAPITRSGTPQEYDAPAQRLSQEYGTPELSSRSLSTEYGIPDARSTPSEEYGAPAIARSGITTGSSKSFGSSSKSYRSQGSSAKSSSESQVPARSNELSYSAPKTSAKNTFGSRTTYTAQSLTSFRVPSSESDSYTQGYSAPSETYGTPERESSDTYEVASARGISQEYGVPLKTDAIASSYSSSRSSPSYVPSQSLAATPSDLYGAPEQYDGNNQSYNSARGALDEVNQDPANYDFAYKVNDFESGSDFGHTESRQEGHAEGSYFVLLPDGTKQTVEYEADEGGFKPRVSVEPASARGYDENASDLARSDGPY